MTLLVPEKTTAGKPGASLPELSDLLVSALEFIGAAAGWIGLQEADGGLTFPVRGGSLPANWLAGEPFRAAPLDEANPSPRVTEPRP